MNKSKQKLTILKKFFRIRKGNQLSRLDLIIFLMQHFLELNEI